MMIGDRLRVLREHKKLLQGDIEKRTGLFRCYISRVEDGHAVPAVETLERFARVLEVPVYQILHEDQNQLIGGSGQLLLARCCRTFAQRSR